ncbi:MAG TPA: acyl-CoA dehydrogenase family protein [Mycobacteriales bacterium]|nr:acyl-CoA dehydrogenase family protein [Mycobacteriales bacterium]
MRLTFDADVEAYRAELCAWLDANAPTAEEATERPTSTADVPAWARAWQRKMFDAGWLVPGNPPEYGGRNASLVEQFVHREELDRRNIAISHNPQGLGIIAPSLLAFGTEEQKQRWARPILRAEITAALGMSEPGAGSDLAGLRTRAELKGDHFVINGQKVWTSGAHHADVILAFVRTDPDAPKHKGISCIVVPTDTPGVTRRPFASFVSRDDVDFNEVYFDDAVVPAENLVGELHQGWKVANGSLGHERSMLWLDFFGNLLRFLESFRDAVGSERNAASADDALVLDAYGNAAIDTMALKLLGMRAIARARRGVFAGDESLLKLLGSEGMQRANGDAVELLGPTALDDVTPAITGHHLQLEGYEGSWMDRFQRSFAATIAGGTSEIQRNILAERVLGLPR